MKLTNTVGTIVLALAAMAAAASLFFFLASIFEMLRDRWQDWRRSTK